MSKKRWCKFSKERGKHGRQSSSESEEELTVKSPRLSESYNRDRSPIGPSLPPELFKGKIRSKATEDKHREDGKPSLSSRTSKDREERKKVESDERHKLKISQHQSNEKEKIYIAEKDKREPSKIQRISPDNAALSSSSKGKVITEEIRVAGPMLPPHLHEKQGENTTDSYIGPSLPPHLLQKKSEDSQMSPNIPDVDILGPALPPHLVKKLEVCIADGDIGPAIPAHLLKDSGPSQDVAGPTLPPHLVSSSRKVIGPQLPPGFTPDDSSSDDEDTCTIGPDPSLMSTGETSSAAELDERAARARRKLLGLDREEKKERESWMLELPPEKASIIGLGPRQFRQKLAPEMGDRTVWTDTPSDTARKQSLPPKLDDKAIIKKKEIAVRDRMMEKMARKAEKKLKREESLLDMHTKKMKKKSKKEEKEREGQPIERKRFNREEDMQVHRFDEAQKKAIFKRAQLLNDRFSQGESKYL